MHTFLVTLHLLACFTLIVVVLLQQGKGADMGAMLGGGGSQTVFGARGAGNFLTRITAGAAAIFVVTSLSLAYISTQDSQQEIFGGADLEEVAPGAPGARDAAGESPGEAASPAASGPAAPGGLEEIDAPAEPPAPATP